MNVTTTFAAQRLRQYLNRNGLSQLAFARKAGVQQMVISRILQGRICSERVLTMIAAAMGTTLGALIDGEKMDRSREMLEFTTERLELLKEAPVSFALAYAAIRKAQGKQ